MPINKAFFIFEEIKRIMNKIIFLLLLGITICNSQNNITLSYYLPEGTTYDPNIPQPKTIIGHEVGEWHVTHDKLVEYMKKLARFLTESL